MRACVCKAHVEEVVIPADFDTRLQVIGDRVKLLILRRQRGERTGKDREQSETQTDRLTHAKTHTQRDTKRHRETQRDAQCVV